MYTTTAKCCLFCNYSTARNQTPTRVAGCLKVTVQTRGAVPYGWEMNCFNIIAEQICLFNVLLPVRQRLLLLNILLSLTAPKVHPAPGAAVCSPHFWDKRPCLLLRWRHHQTMKISAYSRADRVVRPYRNTPLDFRLSTFDIGLSTVFADSYDV
jgi:hypothetical protein